MSINNIEQGLLSSAEQSISNLNDLPATDALDENASSVTPPSDEDVIAMLVAMPVLEYERNRESYAKRLGCRPSVLDDLVKTTKKADIQPTSMPFNEVEPFPEKVVPADLFDEIYKIIITHIILDHEQAIAVTLWIAHTYSVNLFEYSPIAIINAPERACGKSNLQTVMSQLSYRPLSASNASLSALFRAIELWKVTLFIDEADTFFKDNSELHGLVNAGYKRGGSVIRCETVGDSFEPHSFNVFGAKCLAGIALEKHLPDSTISRGILLNLRRKMSHETVMRMRYADNELFDALKSKLLRFAADYTYQVRIARPTLPEELSDRAQDNWEPLLAIASCAGDEWLQQATAAALKLSVSESKVSTGNELLADIQEVLAANYVTKISTVDLISRLSQDDEKPWATYNYGKSISPRQLSKLLSGYGIKSKTVRFVHNTPKGFETSQFQDAFDRYLTPLQNVPQLRHDLADLNDGMDLDVSSTTNNPTHQSKTDEDLY